MVTNKFVIILDMTHNTSPLDVPKNPVARRAWILYQFRIRGLSGRQIAREQGVSPQTVSQSMMGTGSSHLQDVIAAAIGLTPQQLFPEKFDGSGCRLGNVRPPNRTTREDAGNVENRGAA